MDGAKKMKADNILTEDQARDFESEVQDFTDKPPNWADICRRSLSCPRPDATVGTAATQGVRTVAEQIG